MNSLTEAERADVFRSDESFRNFNSALQEMSNFLNKFEKAGKLPILPNEKNKFKEEGTTACDHVFREEFYSLKSAKNLTTKRGRLMYRATKDLTAELQDFYQVFEKNDTVKNVESSMRAKNLDRENQMLEASAERQTIFIKSQLTDVATQKADVAGMMKLLKSTKSVFLKDSNYFTDLENNLNALKNFTDRLPQDMKKLDEEQTKKLTELYKNTYKAADAYINRPNQPGVPVARGSRMNMALRIREAMRPGAAAYMALDKIKKREAAKAVNADNNVAAQNVKADKKVAAKNVNADNNNIKRINSMKTKTNKKNEPDKISRQFTMGH